MNQTNDVRKTKISIIIFSVVTIMSGWLGALINKIQGANSGGGSLESKALGDLIWLILPLLTVILLRLFTHDWKDMGLKLNLRKSWKWYLFSLFAYPALSLLLLSIGMITGWLDIKALNIEVSFSSLAAAFLTYLVLKIFEELPWRGYLAPKLLELKINDWFVYLINGFVWSSWHYAYWMIFLPDSFFETTSRLKMCIVGTIVLTLWTVMYVEILRLSKSVWPCVLIHIVEDLIFLNIFTSWEKAVDTGKGWLIDPEFGVISVGFLFGMGLLLRAIRIKKENSPEEIISNL